MDTPLTHQKCVPCEGGTKPMLETEYAQFLDRVPGWSVLDQLKLQREFKFKNFKEALNFLNQVGAIAETEGHHPDLNLHSWNRLTITLTTHAIKGLSLNDFILAAKINELTSPLQN